MRIQIAEKRQCLEKRLFSLSLSCQNFCSSQNQPKTLQGRGSAWERVLPEQNSFSSSRPSCNSSALHQRYKKIIICCLTFCKNQDYPSIRTKRTFPAWTTAPASPSYQSLSKLSFPAGISSNPMQLAKATTLRDQKYPVKYVLPKPFKDIPFNREQYSSCSGQVEPPSKVSTAEMRNTPLVISLPTLSIQSPLLGH